MELNYRCTNCKWATRQPPPSCCPVCGIVDFEQYHPVKWGLLQSFLVVVVLSAYVAGARIVGQVYDPFWLIGAGIKERNVVGIYFGLGLCILLLPGMFAWVAIRKAFAYVISIVAWLLWIFSCICIKVGVFE